MLSGERCLPEGIFQPDGEVVNRVFPFLCLESDGWMRFQVCQVLRKLQVLWFEEFRGRVCCPRCGGVELIRKGWRERLPRSSRGILRIDLLQASCKYCGRTFRPFKEQVGLPFRQRSLDELSEKGIRLGISLSFDKASSLLKHLTGGSLSAGSIRSHIAREAGRICLPSDAGGRTVLVDATKVRATAKKRGESVHLAITAEPGPKVHNRPTIIKQLLHLHVGGVEKLKGRLEQIRPERLVHDGESSFRKEAKEIQRCLWHIPHLLDYYLYLSGVPIKERRRYQKRLRFILWDQDGDAYDTLIQEMEEAGLTHGASHLRNARMEACAFLEERFSYTTTSPLEREMREINRRADVGARWSIKGIENVLKVLMHRRLNQKHPEYGK